MNPHSVWWGNNKLAKHNEVDYYRLEENKIIVSL